jgi:hypothetical protein
MSTAVEVAMCYSSLSGGDTRFRLSQLLPQAHEVLWWPSSLEDLSARTHGRCRCVRVDEELRGPRMEYERQGTFRFGEGSPDTASANPNMHSTHMSLHLHSPRHVLISLS